MREYRQTEEMVEGVRHASGDSLARGALAADVAVTLIVIVGMALDRHSVTVALLSGVTFFLTFGTLVLLTLSGTLSHIVVNGQQQKTLRARDRLAFEATQPLSAPSLSVVPPQQLAADPLPALPTFVAPTEDGVHREAVGWLLALYGADGLPDPAKVNMVDKKERAGRVRAKHPSGEALQFLFRRRVLHDLGNAVRLNVVRCPNVQAAKEAVS